MRMLLPTCSHRALVVALLLGGLAACGSNGSTGGGEGTGATADTACAAGSALTGASYDIGKSRFAFGSTPVKTPSGDAMAWVGDHGNVFVYASGREGATLDSTAPESALPDWSGSGETLTQHVQAYFEGMGVPPCEIASGNLESSGGSSGSTAGGTTVFRGSSTVVLSRAVDGIPVSESLAFARFDSADQTTEEGFYWPEVPADVVSTARAFRDALKDPAALAAYKAKLPSSAQGQGSVVIHHSGGDQATPFRSGVTYDVIEDSHETTWSSDPEGAPVTTPW